MRQFLAVELSDEWRADLGSLQQCWRAQVAGWRWVRPESVHLTLRFLGEVSEEFDSRCRESWREATAGSSPFTLRLAGSGWFPPRARPRVLWVGVREEPPSGRLEALAASLERTARAVGFQPEHRAFRPHLTLARAQRGARAGLPERHEFASRSSLEVHRLVLFRSELLPSGARYSVLDTFPLLGS